MFKVISELLLNVWFGFSFLEENIACVKVTVHLIICQEKDSVTVFIRELLSLSVKLLLK